MRVFVFGLALLTASGVAVPATGGVFPNVFLVTLAFMPLCLIVCLCLVHPVRVWAWLRTPQPMIGRRTKPVRESASTESEGEEPTRPEPSPSFAPNPVVTPDVYGNNPTLGVFKPTLHAVRDEMPRHDERLIVSLQEAVNHRIVEGLSLSALRKASQRGGFPPMVTRERRGNVGAPERLYRASELAAWSRARMQHHAAPR